MWLKEYNCYIDMIKAWKKQLAPLNYSDQQYKPDTLFL